MVKRRKSFNISTFIFIVLVILFGSIGISQNAEQILNTLLGRKEAVISINAIPEYNGIPFVEINGGVPDLGEGDITVDPFEIYGELDVLGRCGSAFANVCRETMPTEEREPIAEVIPTGFINNEYDFIENGYLYNRCHLIGFQLTGENANEKNLITGTRYMNVEGMLPIENKIADHIYETDGHVLYRVTPIFEGVDLVAKGLQIEAYSVEDRGKEVCLNVFVYNVQPGIEIDYLTGENKEINKK